MSTHTSHAVTCDACGCTRECDGKCSTCQVCGAEKPIRQIIYRVEVSVTVPLSYDPDDADYPTLEGAASSSYKRDIERTMFACLRKFEWPCDVELMDFTVEDE